RMELRADTRQGRGRARHCGARRHQPRAAAGGLEDLRGLCPARLSGCDRRRGARCRRGGDPHPLGRLLPGAHLGPGPRRAGPRGDEGARVAAFGRVAIAGGTVDACHECDPPSSAVVRTRIPGRHRPDDAHAHCTGAVVILTLARSSPAEVASLARTRPALDRGRVEIWDVSVRVRRGRETITALENASVDISHGSFACLLGPSGCGKSTLLNTVAGYVRPTTGWVRVDGDQVVRPGPDRGMVFQQYSLFPWKTVRDNVAFGPYAQGQGRARARAIADELLDMVGLTRFAHRYPTELSGGMQQRVGIARALANKPTVLLMDEPFGSLDAQTRAVMQENLLRLWAEFKTTVLFVTHDVDEAIFLADRVLIMSAAP